MKKKHTHTTLRKIVFLIESLPSAELFSRTLMELWMSGYEAERLPVGRIPTRVSHSVSPNDLLNDAAAFSLPPAPDGAALSRSPVSDTAPPQKAAPHPLSQTLLIVTDRADIAEAALYHDFAVIGCLHEKNKDAPFCGVRYLIEDISGLDARFCELVFCRAHGLPFTVLETERCLIREITLEDVPRLYEIYADPAVTRYIEALYADETAERSYIRDYIDHVYGFYDYGMWVVIHKESGLLIGRAGIEPKEDFAELGYIIAKEYQNQGYATEVCRAILVYAADCFSLTDIRVRVRKDNAASLRICEKLHFQQLPRPEDDDMLMFTLRLNGTN